MSILCNFYLKTNPISYVLKLIWKTDFNCLHQSISDFNWLHQYIFVLWGTGYKTYLSKPENLCIKAEGFPNRVMEWEVDTSTSKCIHKNEDFFGTSILPSTVLTSIQPKLFKLEIHESREILTGMHSFLIFRDFRKQTFKKMDLQCCNQTPCFAEPSDSVLGRKDTYCLVWWKQKSILTC